MIDPTDPKERIYSDEIVLVVTNGGTKYLFTCEDERDCSRVICHAQRTLGRIVTVELQDRGASHVTVGERVRAVGNGPPAAKYARGGQGGQSDRLVPARS